MADQDDHKSIIEFKQSYSALTGWYYRTRLRARREDIFAGMFSAEFLILDGDALIEHVLNDESLNIEGVCFQVSHARYLLEQLLHKFKTHSRQFAIVFFEVHHCMPTASRGNMVQDTIRISLFRTLLRAYMNTLPFPVHTFEDLTSQSWKSFLDTNMPGTICTSLVDFDHSSTPHNLQLIRMTTAFYFNTNSVNVADLDSLQFEESKGMTFVIRQYGPPSAGPPSDSVESPHINIRILLSHRKDILSNSDTTAIRPQDQGDANSWRYRVLQLFLKHHEGREPVNIATLRVWFAHQALLSLLSPADRALPPPPLSPSLGQHITNHFYPLLFPILQAELEGKAFVLDVDGSVFGYILDHILGGESLEDLVGTSVIAGIDALWTTTGGAAPRTDVLATSFARAAPKAKAVAPSRPSIRTLPFSHSVFDNYTSDIRTLTDHRDPLSDNKKSLSILLSPFAGVVDPQLAPVHRTLAKPPPVDAKARFRKLKREQRQMTYLTRLAGSLTGAAGAVLQQQVIVASTPTSSNSKSKPEVPKNKTNPAKAPTLSKADQIRQANTKQKAAQADASADTWWRNRLDELKKLPLNKQEESLDLLCRNPKAQEDWLRAEMALYRLDLIVRAWIEDPKAEDMVLGEQYRVRILAESKNLSCMKGCTPGMRKTFAGLFKALGMDGVQLPKHPDGDSADRNPLFSFTKTWSKSHARPVYPYFLIQESRIEFQLRAFGEFMDRSMDSRADHRTSFDPDAWQVAVLDKIDQRSSILVVAPTSAGKTFIGFYAMEKILRESDEGVLIYVAPTKALVTQVGAEVYARFRKARKGGSCWAIHTREIQLNNALEAQILVTIPEVLFDLYMNPALSKTWIPRIRYVIFDEIHSISEAGGTTWTQLILMTRSPIIGLSATIGGPVAFNTWLESVQHAHDHKHALIMHPHRYSHLRKFAWAGSDANAPLRLMHPLAPLALGFGDSPADLSLESRDCLALYLALVAHCGPDSKDRFAELEPNTFFKARTADLLRQKDVIEYEAALKQTVQSLSRSPELEDRMLAEKALGSLSTRFVDVRPGFDPRTVFFMHDEGLGSELDSLLNALSEKRDLPALLFTFSRYKMDLFARHLLNSLIAAEEAYRATSPKWKKNLQEWDQWLKAKTKKREPKTSKRKGGGGADDDGGKRKDVERGTSAVDDGASLQPPPGVQDPDEPSPEFSYASFKRYTRQELEDDIKELAWSKIDEWVLECLKRGIALHHAGMPKPYRSLIETLFRLGFIRVMFSTETLALGINAPARTSIFLGDSKLLSPLLYRQCAGRAGRRGFDLLGKVVFIGIPLTKICRLNLANLEPVTGRYPVTATFALQSLRLLYGSNEDEAARRAVDGVLSVPRLTVDTAVGPAETACLLRFGIDFLRRSKLVDEEGTPLTLAPLAASLHEFQPGNLALVSLIGEGYFHKLCADFGNNKDSVMRVVVLVLAHLFVRRHMLRLSPEVLADSLKRSSSVLMLPVMPQEAQGILEAYNRRVLDVYAGCAFTCASQTSQEPGNDAATPIEGDPQTPANIVQSLRDKSIRPIARSVFVANSGRGDEYDTIHELCTTSRQGINLQSFMTPYLELPNKTTPWFLNAAIYDFFINGSVNDLEKTNGIGRGEVWYILDEFSRVLNAIQTALEQIFKDTIKAAGSGVENISTRDRADIDDVLEDVEDILGEGTSAAFPERPKEVPDDDWDVYRTFVAINAEFDEKFKAMWA